MSSDEQAIRDLVSTWMSATKAGDTQTVLSLMTDDAVFMVPGQQPFGKTAFAAASQGMQGIKIDGSHNIEELQVCGDWAWMRNRLRVTVTPPNGVPFVRSGYAMTILRKNAAGQWQLARDANLLTLEKTPPA